MPARAPGARDSALGPSPAARAAGGRGFRFLDRVDEEALTRFTTQLSVLQDAGLPIVRCLKILEGQMKPGLFKRTLAAVTEDVEAGSPLSEALAKHPAVFDALPGVSVAHQVESSLTLTVKGAVDPVVKTAAGHTVVDVVAAPADLEELFLGYYEGDGDGD